MNVEVQIEHYYFKVLINGYCHVCIDRSEFIGYQSWMDADTMCVIEYYTKTNKITTQQDSIEKWKELLKALNDNL